VTGRFLFVLKDSRQRRIFSRQRCIFSRQRRQFTKTSCYTYYMQNYASATREQALAIAVRMVENLKVKPLDYK
jgi:hypothetical protein